MLGVFYIGRMLTPDVDLLPTHLRAKIKTIETGAGDTNYINERRVSGVTRGYRNNPPDALEWSPDMRTVTGRRPARPFGPSRMRFPNGVRVFHA